MKIITLSRDAGQKDLSEKNEPGLQIPRRFVMRRSVQAITLSAALLVVGCGSDDSTFNYGFFPNPTSSPVTNPPVAVADSFSTLGNSVLSGSVVANDTVNGATVTAFQNPSNSGGTVAVTAAGQLTYTPPANVSNIVDTFTYTLVNSAGSSTATVTVNVQARGFFVKNDVAVTGTGTQSNPFKTLAEAVAAATGVNGAQIVVFRGDGTSTGMNTPVNLGTNQGIQGQDQANPPLLTGPVILTTGNLVQDLRFANASTAVNGTNASGGTINRIAVNGASNKGVALLGTASGTWSISNSSFASVANGTVDAITASGSLVLTVSNCTFASSALSGIFVNPTGTAAHNVTVQNSSFSQGAGGVGELILNATTTGATGLNLTNNTVTGGGTASRGINIATQGATQLTARILNNTISGFTNEGLFVSISGNSSAKMRFEGNRTTGNAANNGWNNTSGATATLQSVYKNNTSDRFNFVGSGGTSFQVEELANFNTSSGNTGTLSAIGGVQDVPAGSLNIP
ncbi:MAG: Ig-like domain-containing protein [Vulcanimicrobiota bacterium]